MSTQTNTMNVNSAPTTVSTDSSQTSGQDQGSGPVTIGQLMSLLSQAQINFGNLQEVLATSCGHDVVDPKTGAVSFETFAQQEGDVVIKAAQDETQKVIEAVKKAAEANKKRGIFGKIAAAFSIVVAISVVVATGGAASALIPLAITAVMSSMTLAGKQDPFQMAVQKLQEVLPKGKGFDILATCLVAVAVAIICGGASSAKMVGAEVGLQLLLDTGLPTELGALVPDDKKGLKYFVEISCALLIVAGTIGAGYGMANAADAQGVSNLSKMIKNLNLDEAKVYAMTQGIQGFSQLVVSGFSVASATSMINAAKATYDAQIGNAYLAQLYGQLDMINNSGQSLQNSISSLLGEINDELSEIAMTAGADLQALAQV